MEGDYETGIGAEKEPALYARGYSMGHMRNRNEFLVAKAMEEVIPEYSPICECAMCVEDIFALSLNSLPAKYQHSMSIDIHKKATYEEVCKKVKESVELVRKKPKHT